MILNIIKSRNDELLHDLEQNNRRTFVFLKAVIPALVILNLFIWEVI